MLSKLSEREGVIINKIDHQSLEPVDRNIKLQVFKEFPKKSVQKLQLLLS